MSNQYDATKVGQQAVTLGGAHTSAGLNKLYANIGLGAPIPAGSVAYTTDIGPCMFNGSTWGTMGSGSGLSPIATASLLGNSSGVSALPTAQTSFPVGVTTSGGGVPVGAADSQTLTNKSVDGGTNTLTNLPGSQIVGSLNVATITGTLDVVNGGTGAATLTGILKGNGTSAIGNATAANIAATFSGGFTDSNHYLATDGSQQALVVGSPSNIQIFANAAGSGTWAKPSGTPKYVRVIAIGGGAGGGGGAQIATGTTMCGGGGGGAGFYQDVTFDVSVLGSTETVTVGAGGNGGNAGSGGSGSSGTAGGTTTFGAWVSAFGGGAGQGGQATTSNAGGGGGGPYAVGTSGGGGGAAGGIGGGAGGTTGGVGASASNAGGGGGSTVGNTTGSVGGNSINGPTGGGAGGGLAASPTASSGGAGGRNAMGLTAAPGGGASTGGSTRTPTTGVYLGGAGGGGGGSSTAATAGTGGAGTRGGGGGGGGAALTTTATAGAGGVGGDGYCVVITTF